MTGPLFMLGMLILGYSRWVFMREVELYSEDHPVENPKP